MVRIAITGVCGKVGAAILRLALEDKEVEITGVLEAKGHPLSGKELSLIAGRPCGNLVVEDDPERVIGGGAEVVIDFTSPGATMAHYRIAKKADKGIVIGTTGFSGQALEEITKGTGVRVVISPNMSVGMNLMFDAVEKLARRMKDDYDIEILEMHHRLKKDAPSGTALKLKEIVETSDPEREWIEVYGRQGLTGERKREEVAVLSLRGGDVVGEHTVVFAGAGERVEVTHRAYSRENFAKGAIVAAKWLAEREHGVYSMKQVLGL